MHAGNTRLILLCASCLLPKESIWVELPPDIPGNVARLSTWVLQKLGDEHGECSSPANPSWYRPSYILKFR